MTPSLGGPPRPASEVPASFPREWIQFADPGNPDHIISADLTWLCSRWTCVFGTTSCHGITGDATLGCCGHGAFLCDDEDRGKLRAAVARLAPGEWQLAPTAEDTAPDPAIEAHLEWDELEDEETGEVRPALRTRLVDGACIFLNRPDHPSGGGCALHQMALRTGLSLVDAKPEVCWQVPIRRLQEWETRPDGAEYLHTRITEYDRACWGEGGADLTWYCSGSPEAHVADTPLWTRHRDELVALLGEPVCTELAIWCARRDAAGPLAEHPATAGAGPFRSLPLRPLRAGGPARPPQASSL